jgi:hypothetical protein
MLIDEVYERVDKKDFEEANVGFRSYLVWEGKPSDNESISNVKIKGVKDGFSLNEIKANFVELYGDNDGDFLYSRVSFSDGAFANLDRLQRFTIICDDQADFSNEGTGNGCFQNCRNLEEVNIYIKQFPRESSLDNYDCKVLFDSETFFQCHALKKINIYTNREKFRYQGVAADNTLYTADAFNLVEGDEVEITPYGIRSEVTCTVKRNVDYDDFIETYDDVIYDRKCTVTEVSIAVLNVINETTGENVNFAYKSEPIVVGNEYVKSVKYVYFKARDMKHKNDEGIEIDSSCKIHLNTREIKFNTIEGMSNFYDGNPDYEGTGVEAINGCTKSAVFDGRIFLTGNKYLPNTVFYSNRNLTGANDPTYFGAYNYFNDGDGNTPNIDLLSTPSMLMVLKNNTVQDGSVYYHTPAYNEDEYSRDLVPRIYPSTSGAAGLGSSGSTVPGTTACNFLDDPVFLSTRGLEAVGKQTVNLERTLTHRSGNVDRLLIKEDLSRAALAEWKGYLVICCDGRFYLADSRQMHQHPDGSYQYEWYYLEGLGCYKDYYGGYRYLDSWYAIDEDGNSLGDCTLIGGGKLSDVYLLSNAGEYKGSASGITVLTATRPNGSEFYFYTDGVYALDPVDEERVGAGEFFSARKIAVVGERLFFGTEGGDVCVINTDKRGVSDDFDGDIGTDRISTRWYSFHGVAYPSICVTRLDDCSKKSLAKGTVPGTTVARFKMMPGSHLRANVSLNGRDFKKIGEAFASRYDAAAIRFDNFSFTENEDAVVVLRELTRNWVDKQYSFVSDGFREPFGLYEISYLYTVKGKIRKPFALIERKEK